MLTLNKLNVVTEHASVSHACLEFVRMIGVRKSLNCTELYLKKWMLLKNSNDRMCKARMINMNDSSKCCIKNRFENARSQREHIGNKKNSSGVFQTLTEM